MDRTIGWVLAACVLSVLPAPLPAQDTLRVEQGRVDGSLIEPFSVVWRATPRGADGTPARSFTVEERYEVVHSDGDALLKMTQVWNDTVGEPVFITVRVAERKSMEYRAFHTGRTPGGVAHLDFDEGFVSGMYAPAPEERIRRFALQLDERPFAMVGGLVLAAFPLEEGAEFAYPGFGWGGLTNPTTRWRTAKVVARERLSVPDAGQVSAWKVEDAGGTSYWLSPQAPYFLKAVSTRSGGGTTEFEILSWTPGAG